MGLVERSSSVTILLTCAYKLQKQNRWSDITNSVDKHAAQAPNEKHAQVDSWVRFFFLSQIDIVTQVL